MDVPVGRAVHVDHPHYFDRLTIANSSWTMCEGVTVGARRGVKSRRAAD
jgi:hypothetical protein